jgi:DNA-binding SARP family transcriptional activator
MCSLSSYVDISLAADTFDAPPPKDTDMVVESLHPADARPIVRLLGSFRLEIGGSAVGLPIQSQRLVGFLSIAGRPERRETVAGRLWGDLDQGNAQACLRTALWRIRKIDPRLVNPTGAAIALGPDVDVDVHRTTSYARDLIQGSVAPKASYLPGLLEDDLLPGWEDDWVLFERERWRQLRIHALECLARQLSEQGDHPAAIEAAVAAVAAEPLRDSAHAVLIETHLREGNRAEAARQFTRYTQIMRRELGLPPSRRVADLLR